MSSSPILSIRGLAKRYRLFAQPKDRLLQAIFPARHGRFTEVDALKPMSLEVFPGETLGILGRNGSGKSTLLQLICSVLTPSEGTIKVVGRISALLELGAGFNPDFTGRENVFLNGAIMGLSKREIASRFEDIAQFAAIGDFIEQPVRTYSSGMFVRLAFAVAVASDPDILVVDEALAVGDEAFQRKCYARIAQMKARGATILFVSHSMQAMAEICDRAILLDAGEMLALGAPKKIIAQYHKLIYADPRLQPAIREEIRLGVTITEGNPAFGGHFDPHQAVPESQVTYPPNGGVLQDASMEDAHGARVNLLHSGEEYTYCYRFTAEETVTQIELGLLIKTKTGIELGGVTAPPMDMRAGESVRMRFHFRCNLRYGTYFMNCGAVSRADGGERFLHRIIDATQFQVLRDPTQDSGARGMIDFNIRSEVVKSQPA